MPPNSWRCIEAGELFRQQQLGELAGFFGFPFRPALSLALSFSRTPARCDDRSLGGKLFQHPVEWFVHIRIVAETGKILRVF